MHFFIDHQKDKKKPTKNIKRLYNSELNRNSFLTSDFETYYWKDFYTSLYTNAQADA